MIKSLKKRTEDALNHASSELSLVRGVDRKANYVKLLQLLQEAQREFRELALEADTLKDQWKI